MRGHVTKHDLQDLMEGHLPAMSLGDLSSHLQACRECSHVARQLFDPEKLAQAFAFLDEHPSAGEIATHVAGEADEAVREWIEVHIERCSRCLEDIDDLRHKQSVVRRLWTSLAAAIVLVLSLVGVSVWLRALSKNDTTPSKARLQQSTTDPRGDPWNSVKIRILNAGRIDAPPIIRQLHPPRQSMRGVGDGGLRGTAMRPVGKVLESERPVFSWTMPAGATAVVSIFADYELVMVSGPLHSSMWTSSRPLPRGRTYLWQVEIQRSDGTSSMEPDPSMPEALFHIIDASTMTHLSTVATARPDDHLLLGILYAQAGLQDRALSEFDRYLVNNRFDKRVVNLRDSVRSW